MNPADVLRSRAFQRTWSPDMEARIGAMMVETAKGEWISARQRDGMYPAGNPSMKRPMSLGAQITPRGIAALEILASEPGITTAELARRSGLSESRARDIIRDGIGKRPPGPRPNTGGRERSEASKEAERLLIAGTDPSRVVEITGMSRRNVYRIRDRVTGKTPLPKCKRTAASIEAERLIRSGKPARVAMEATGLSEAQAYRIAQRIREERNPA